MFAVNVDNGIFASPNDEDITQAIKDLKTIKCDIEDQGELSNNLGVNIKQEQEITYLTQPHLIDQIVRTKEYYLKRMINLILYHRL